MSQHSRETVGKHCTHIIYKENYCFGVFKDFFELLFDRTTEERTGNGGEKEGMTHIAKDHRVESNLGLLQWGHSLCTWGVCSTN